MGRSTTGTPPRIDSRTIDFSGLESQGSDDPIQPFSFLHDFEGFVPPHKLIRCYRTKTNADTHAVIEKYRHLLPTFEGNNGEGTGPRYCPAIEKKVLRFPDKAFHEIWL